MNNSDIPIASTGIAELGASPRMNKKPYTVEKKSTEYVSENADLDKALALTGYGRFHYELLASCAFCLVSSGLQNGLSAYVLSAAHCELHLTSSQIGIVNAAFLVGGMCSSFLWGIIADLTGRKKVLVITLLLDVVVTLCCSLMQEFIGLVVCRFVSGFLIGAPGSLTFTYLAEFHAPQHRSKSVYYSGVFYTLSWLLLPTVAWIILPLQIEVKIADIVVCSSWRIFLVLLTLPELIAGVWLIYLPESPKFLAVMEPKKTLNVLRQMYHRNTGKDKNEFPVKSLMNHVKIWNHVENGVNCRGKVARIIEDISSQINNLLKGPLLLLTLLLSGIMFSNMFGYFGLGLWLPALLKRFQAYQVSNSSDIAHLTNFTRTISGNESCFPDFDNTLYESTVAMGISSLVGNLFTGWLAGRFEQRVIPLVVMLSGGISAGSIYWINTSFQFLVAACVFQSTMSTANIAIGSVIVELFPTSVNAIAMCTAMFAGRIGAILSNIVFGFLMDLHCEIALFLVAGILLIGAVLCLMIPNDTEVKKGEAASHVNNVEVSVISITSL